MDSSITSIFTKKRIIGAIIALFVIITAFDSYFTSDEGYTYLVQDTLFHSDRVISHPGINFTFPYFTKVYRYKMASTVTFTIPRNDVKFAKDSDSSAGNFTRKYETISASFADTYNAYIPITFRFRLPSDPQKFRRIHDDFRNFDNLTDALLVKVAKNVAVVTATQYTGEEFFQGSVSSYRSAVLDQLENGLYVTDRQQVEIKQSDIAPVSSDNHNSAKIEQQTQLVWKNVVRRDANGNIVRQKNQLEDYGIIVAGVDLGQPVPGATLDGLLKSKRELVGQRIALVQQQDNLTEQAKVEQLKQDVEKRKAIQIADKERELQLIDKQREVAVETQNSKIAQIKATKEKNLALIDKKRELEMAQADRDIQAAQAEAAKFQAVAIREKGLAEADVQKAKLAAKQSAKDIYMAEVQVELAQAIYPNLQGTTVSMPNFMVINGQSADGKSVPTNSVDTFLSLSNYGLANKLISQQ